MKTLENKREIAEYINVKSLTTIRIDLADADSYGIKSQKIRIDNGYFKNHPDHKYYIHAEIRAYHDTHKFEFHSFNSYLTDSFGYYDMEEMLEYSNSPIVKPDSDIVICVVNSVEKKVYKPIILHTSNRINAFCNEPLQFVDKDNDAMTYLLNVNPEVQKTWYGWKNLNEN